MTDPFKGTRAIVIACVIAVLGFALCALGLMIAPTRTCFAYLSAFAAATSIAVGALIMQMIGYAANAKWMAVVRRLGDSLTAPLPILALLFIPLPLAVTWLYPWAQPRSNFSSHVQGLLEHRSSYLNLAGYIGRGVGYFAIWIIVAELLRMWSRRRDGQPVAKDGMSALARERVLSSAMLPLVGLASTFASVDWLMSLEPAWYSTMFGVYYFSGGFVAALALLTILTALAREHAGLQATLTPNHFHALGRMMLAFIVFWAYAAFFQAMLIAIANKPEEVEFYLVRSAGPWSIFMYILVLGHFGAPFAVLPCLFCWQGRSVACFGVRPGGELHYVVISITTFGAVAVAAAMVYFLVRYSHRNTNDTEKRSGIPVGKASMRRIEIVAVTGMLTLFLGWWVIGMRQYIHIYKAPRDSLDVYVVGKQ